MKDKFVSGLSRKPHFLISIFVIIGLFIISCEPDSSRLGADIFPSGDTIRVYADTIINLDTRLVSSRARVTSETGSYSRLFLLGSKVNPRTGLSKAEIVTSISIVSAGDFGSNPYVDSLLISLYFAEVEGDTTQDMHITIYELTDTLSYGLDYYSDFDMTGKYNPVPLADKVIKPKPNTYYEFPVTNQDYIDKVKVAVKDTVFLYRSLTENMFRGLYITTENVNDGGAFAKVIMANSLSGLKFRYLKSDKAVESAVESDYLSYSLDFNPYYAQKVNIFHHDYSGTELESQIDNPNAEPQIGYVQGTAGVNTRVTLPDMNDILGNGLIAINTAKLLFYVVPDSISGIPSDQYPARLMLETNYPDTMNQPIYDQIISSNTSDFGKLKRSNEVNAFVDSLYFYSFQIGRHLQSVITGELENEDFTIYLENATTNSDGIEFWSNYSGQKGSLRLEVIYTKF